LSEPERVNVMISRGKNLVIMVGSAEHFMNSDCDFWDYLTRMAEMRRVPI
jgi:hypothetical protein